MPVAYHFTSFARFYEFLQATIEHLFARFVTLDIVNANPLI